MNFVLQANFANYSGAVHFFKLIFNIIYSLCGIVF